MMLQVQNCDIYSNENFACLNLEYESDLIAVCVTSVILPKIFSFLLNPYVLFLFRTRNRRQYGNFLSRQVKSGFLLFSEFIN